MRKNVYTIRELSENVDLDFEKAESDIFSNEDELLEILVRFHKFKFFIILIIFLRNLTKINQNRSARRSYRSSKESLLRFEILETSKFNPHTVGILV